MSSSMIIADTTVQYDVKEGAVIGAALAWMIVVGSTAAAAILMCGWKGARNVSIDWRSLKATFYCR